MASNPWKKLRCEVCGRLREFRHIAVHTFEAVIKESPVTRNVAYCYDDMACRDGARVKADDFNVRLTLL